jgi:hypothetical protein
VSKKMAKSASSPFVWVEEIKIINYARKVFCSSQRMIEIEQCFE